ncbi:CbtB domain-containing protein [Mangrovicella endophytica]|uniref:CbtB domain-containing protein n=1 Tax=Mangrovicella endophytica TaxID=2066697 RepID=UPI000C9DB7EB|nr:CbtB-domain containing protein [Mangrovicella endophytica]
MSIRTGTVADLSASTRLAVGIAALFTGAFLIWGVGFAHSEALHDTAHDVRHSYGFPCH